MRKRPNEAHLRHRDAPRGSHRVSRLPPTAHRDAAPQSHPDAAARRVESDCRDLSARPRPRRCSLEEPP
ncbi:MAG: hypothetical protein MZU84_03340 [Sphingobacterium sp.]|nr:hypothetical protein [Sphingobacterium sp.]